jgi:protoporphyrinogen oxidase
MGKKVLVLGGGASGISAAWKLIENGVNVEIIESNKELGGLASTVQKNGYHLDYGPHFFLSEKPEIVKRVTSLFKEDVGKDMPTLKRDAKLLFNGKFLNYPLTIKNILFEIPITDSIMIVTSYFARQAYESIKGIFSEKTTDENFEIWAKKNFGDYLFKIFFKPYTEMFWGINPKKLAPRTLPTNTRLSFFKTLKLIFARKLTKKNLSLVERETTLLLRYPFKGIGMVPNAIGRKIKKLGGKIHPGFHVKRVERQNDGAFKVIAAKDGKNKSFKSDYLISTIPLTCLMEIIKPEPPKEVMDANKKIGFLSLIILYIVIPKRNILDSTYLYFVGTPFNRISEMNKFSEELCPPDENMLAVEISCNHFEKIWKYDKEKIYDMCIKSLEKYKIISRKEVKKYFMLKARYAYPIFYHDHAKYLKKIMNYADSIPNLWLTGRSGKYLYVDIDQCMVNSFNLVDSILPKIKPNKKSKK